MGACRIVNASMVAAKESLDSIAQQYETAGAQFVSDLNNALAEMEGDSKDALKEFIDKKVNDFVATDLAAAIKGMSSLLEANRSNFELADKKIAEAIRDN